ncbi:Ferric reductase transmembrane component 4 [Colletotrichum higginsianum IMI 349063]|uniref:Ferric reductase transmembrane component 4 n=1 Tax=Colletotrichum higginsianum (strain IMI 349063) TaxID=759273 RepID=A0A1B7YMH1_COLHI|nr:Ferric reductase transmembrane component 4 [Colletotrichum higginsianum IMI 349063]OBR13251.1 Ferric reductase transmembrane component 4 [Colletotrichum higginsianum IMI 349063]
MLSPNGVLLLGVLASLPLPAVLADGRGLIGWGKTMYHPPCAFACRGVIKGCPLLCTPTHGGSVHGSGHSTTTTPPECYTSDDAFLRTMALCLDTYCPLSDNAPRSLLEDYWAAHLATGTVGDYQWKPVVSYSEALVAARADEARVSEGHGTNATDTNAHSGHGKVKARHDHGGGSDDSGTGTLGTHSALPTIKAKQPLNVTSFIVEADWQKQYNGMTSFEINETGHATYTIIVTLVALFLPVVLAFAGFVPGITRSRTWTWLNSTIIHPAVWGTKHREPVAIKAGGGIVPTRGQALYIAVISFLNVIFLLAPYHMIQPQSSFATSQQQEVSVIGNRAGNLALGNMVALFFFSARNNPLLMLGDWSHGTFLLLHRWLGYWTILHTVLHSIMLLVYYKMFGDYAAEEAKLYWVWGIVGTVAAVLIWPASLLVVRQKAYELFLSLHHLLVALFLVGFYYHIWYCYTYNWGYEIWAFVAIAIWGLDRIWRLVRMALNGVRTAIVTPVEGSGGDYLRIEIENVHAHGVVYLCFPTLGWRFWENHPFSVASSFAGGHTQPPTTSISTSVSHDDPEKSAADSPYDTQPDAKTHTIAMGGNKVSGPRATFIARTLTGMTAKLSAKLTATGCGLLRIPVLVEGSYHSNATAKLSHCTSLLCIAGGVGVTAVLPIARSFEAPRRSRLVWGVRHETLVAALEPEMAQLPKHVGLSIKIGERINIDAVLREELARDGESGPVGIVVCGPPSMTDEVRSRLSELGRTEGARKAFVLVDEAFSW